MKIVAGLVTVLIPLYNRARYIEETLDSITAQDYSAIEIIVIDDGSTDGGDQIVEGYITSRTIKLLRHPGNVNKGQAAAINLGLAAATGEFIAILDSDDLFAEGKIAKQVEFLNRNPGVGLVYGNGKAVDANGKVIYDINHGSRNEKSDPNEVLLDCYFCLPSNSLVRADVYKKVGFYDESLRAGQDHDMQIRICEATKIAHLPIDSFRYRRHGDSISAKGAETRWRCGLIILKKAVSRYPYKASTIRKRRAVINFRLGQALLRNKKSRVEAVWRIFYAGLLDPSRALRVLMGSENLK